MANQKQETDSRQAVRIVDRILFSYEKTPAEQFKKVSEDFQNGITPYNQEGLNDIQMFVGAQNALARIREKDRDLADFLQHLDAKMNLLLKKTGGEKTPFDRLTLQEANISGSGMAFNAPKLLEVNTVLTLHIVLLPDHTFVYCFGKVVNCVEGKSSDPQRPYTISVKFILIMEEDREKLIQHNFKQQSLALRQRRQQK